MGEGMANFLLIALLVMGAVFLFRRFFGNSQPSQHASLAGAGAGGAAPMRFEPVEAPVGGGTSDVSVPAGFDTEGFLRQAKLNFIRLQAANDAGNFDDLKQFLAPEIFAEIQLQYEARGRSKQETDVQQLDANLLEVVTEGNQHIASVRFSGTIREDHGAPAAFAEIWHLVKPVSGERGWQVAGIQQIQ
jgi:predicted lipid-binding transport protein (Tim44 family)